MNLGHFYDFGSRESFTKYFCHSFGKINFIILSYKIIIDFEIELLIDKSI